MEYTSRRFILSTALAVSALTAVAVPGVAAAATSKPHVCKYAHSVSLHGPNAGDSGEDIAVDRDGSVFIVGYHSGLDLNKDGKVDRPAFGSTDPVLVKVAADGERSEWVSTAAGPGFDGATAVAPDGTGGAWVAGRFHTGMRFDESLKLASRGETDGFLAHYDAGGKPLMALAIGGDAADELNLVAVDQAGNVLIDGTVRGPVDVDHDGATDVTASAEGSMLLASFDPHGKLRWARALSNSGQSRSGGLAVGVDGAILVSGYYQGPELDLDGDGKADLGASSDHQQGFLARYDAAGRLIWVRSPAGVSFGRLALASNGDILVLGVATKASDFDGDGRHDVGPQGEKQRMLLATYKDNGDFGWVRPFAAGLPTYIAVHGGLIALGGLFKGPLDLDGDGSIDASGDADGDNDGMLAILGRDGKLIEVWPVVGSSFDQVRAVAFSPDGGSIYATGFYRQTVDFDGDGVPEGEILPGWRGDIFIARYDCSNG